MLITILQEYFRSEIYFSKPVSVVIIPVLPKKIEPPVSPPKSIPKTLQKLPPINNKTSPKYLSATPKGKEGLEKTKEETKINETSKYDKNFSAALKRQNPDIFDRDVIAKLSQNSKKNEQLETKQGLSFSAKEFSDWGYLERLKEKIERIWQYPPQAAERGIYGDLYIRFTIDKKGNLVAAELLRTSGYRILDDAAMKALKDAQPFWPLPDDWGKDSLTITGHFIYTLRGFYLR